jgi:hypothetical protein
MKILELIFHAKAAQGWQSGMAGKVTSLINTDARKVFLLITSQKWKHLACLWNIYLFWRQ